ncbi:MAG: glycosyltransferase [Sphingobacteriaceae bacterium]|nr:MAG: glycosyltransferase [Sphingobacteriaceae bacterium]
MVSVIIPNYNHALYLKQRIDSVLNQTYQDFELIILDDKSTDNSKEIIEQYRNHLKVSQIVYNEVNSGTTFKQWNKGIRIAKGELIWFAESDDNASPLFLEELTARFNQNPKLGIVYCDSYYMNEHNEKAQCTHIWKNERFSTNRWNNDYENNGIKEVNDYLIFHNVIDNASSALFKKSAIVAAGMADESFRYLGDLYLYMKILLLYDVAYVAKPLNYFRQHPVNTSKKSFSNGLKQLEDLTSFMNLMSDEKISRSTIQKRFLQSFEDYKVFVIVNLRFNFNLKLLSKGHKLLYKLNSSYTTLLVKSLFAEKLFRKKISRSPLSSLQKI